MKTLNRKRIRGLIAEVISEVDGVYPLYDEIAEEVGLYTALEAFLVDVEKTEGVSGRDATDILSDVVTEFTDGYNA
jgi:hypothetical protein